MDGRITTHEPARRFAMNFVDTMTDVTVDFETAPGADAAHHPPDPLDRHHDQGVRQALHADHQEDPARADHRRRMEQLKALAERG